MSARLKSYDSTMTDAGVRMTDVMMDQYGRIFEFKHIPQYYQNGKRKGKEKGEWIPTGRCGVASH